MQEKEEQPQPYANVVQFSPVCQARRVYIWEDRVFPESQGGGYLSIEDCQLAVRHIWRDLNLSTRAPKVIDGRGSKSARSGQGSIAMPRWSRNYTVLMHEVAHSITELIDDDDNSNHGGVYLHVYFTLMTRYGGRKYNELFKSATEAGLKVKRIKLRSRLKQHMKT